MHGVERPRPGKATRFPAIRQPLPAVAGRHVAQQESPQQCRGVGERRKIVGGRDLGVVDRERRIDIVAIEMKQRAMPREMYREAGVLAPGRLGRGQQGETFAKASPHLQHVGERMDRARMPRVVRERGTRFRLGAHVEAVLFETERMHGEHARVVRHRGIPRGQRLLDAVAQHRPAAESEVERMRGRERDDVARVVEQEGAVAFEREGRVAGEPGLGRGGVAAGGIAQVRPGQLDRRDARRELGARRMAVAAHDDRDAQAVGSDVGRIVGERAVHHGGGIAAMGQQHVEGLLVMRPGRGRGVLAQIFLCRDHGGADGCSRRCAAPRMGYGRWACSPA
jgi:hypothetical protein